MAQAGYTPISLYYSTTASAVPINTNLVNGELAINITDGKLYYKNNFGVVTLLAQSSSSSPVTTFSAGTTGLTPSSATSGAITLAGTLITSNGGTGLSSYTAGDLPYYATGTALSKLAIGTNGQILTSSGTAPQWTSSLNTSQGGTGVTSYTAGDITYYAAGTSLTKLGIGANGQILTSTGSAPQWSTLSSVAVTSISFGTTGLTPSTSTSGAVTVAGTLVVSNGGTGLTSLTAGRIPYGAGTSALGNSANLFWDSANNRLGVNTSSPAVTAAFVGTDAMLIPVGTTGQRPTGATGYFRFNTTTTQFEGFNGTTWGTIGGGAALSNDTTTATALYPLFASATSGNPSTIFTSNAKLLYTPSNGELQSAEMYANNGVLAHAQTVSTSYTVPTNANLITVGPWTVGSGATFTLPSGSRQVLL